MQSDYDHLKQEHENLEERHQRFIIQYGHEGSEAKKGMIYLIKNDFWFELWPLKKCVYLWYPPNVQCSALIFKKIHTFSTLQKSL